MDRVFSKCKRVNGAYVNITYVLSFVFPLSVGKPHALHKIKDSLILSEI